MNGSPRNVAELNDLPIKSQNGATIYVRDVAHVRDGYPPQTNIVRSDGLRGVDDDDLEERQRINARHHRGRAEGPAAYRSTLPPELKVKPVADQSIFVRASINGVRA